MDLQISPLFNGDSIPNFVKFTLSDGLWTMSFTYFLIGIWNGTKNNYIIAITSLAPVTGIALEFLQYFHLINGTFDINDILTITLFYLITLNHYFYVTKNNI